VKVVDQGAKAQPAADDEPDGDVIAEGCDCPRLDPEDWHEVESDWSDITFVRTTTNAVMGVPVGFAGIREELEKKAAKAGARVPDDAMFVLGAGRFRRPVMLEVEDAPRGAKDVVHPGGFAYTRLVPAPWGDMQKVVDQTDAIATEKYGRKPDDVWVWYLTCKFCSSERNFETLIVAHFKE
jgi:hypothetical protein